MGGRAGSDDGRRALKVGLVSVVTLVAFESLAVITILPDIEADLGGIAWYGWVTTAFFLGTMIGVMCGIAPAFLVRLWAVGPKT